MMAQNRLHEGLSLGLKLSQSLNYSPQKPYKNIPGKFQELELT
jgi:hypothetical protein